MKRFGTGFCAFLALILCLVPWVQGQQRSGAAQQSPRPMTDVPTPPNIPSFTFTGDEGLTTSGAPILNICFQANKGAGRGNVFGSYQLSVVNEQGGLLFPPSTGESNRNGGVNACVNGLSLSGVNNGTHMIPSGALFKPSGELLTGVYIEIVKGGRSGILPSVPPGHIQSHMTFSVTIDAPGYVIVPRHGFPYRTIFDPKIPNPRPIGDNVPELGQPYLSPNVYWIPGDVLGNEQAPSPQANLPLVPTEAFHFVPVTDWNVDPETGKLMVNLTDALRQLDSAGEFLIPTGSRLVIDAWRQPGPNESIGSRDELVTPIISG